VSGRSTKLKKRVGRESWQIELNKVVSAISVARVTCEERERTLLGSDVNWEGTVQTEKDRSPSQEEVASN
jgi:hypothetical protein